MNIMKKIYMVLAVLSFIAGLLVIYIFNGPGFIRYYGGDILIVIFPFSAAKAFLDIEAWKVLLVWVLVCYAVEILQYLNLAYLLGLKEGIVKTMVGTHFDFYDILVYTLTGIFLYLMDQILRRYCVK